MKTCLIVYSDYYKDISKSLVDGSIKILKKNNIKYELYCIDGSFEIPQLINIKLKSKKYFAALALGCIIKGQTPHFDIISSSISNSIMDLSIKYSLPIMNGVINCLNKKQAKLRSSLKKNKGTEAANALLSVLKNLK
ncbi:MAG: 6,7-dimethyl-8-ribityllumazine synthase [Candidatus Pelagibacter sp.]|nr:6,7-dimethyl-8-ribityllumazine synthase [Candidatus Pelagibacter sp.]OUV86583.1 MAG: 6,7-dimethyl-8-ribityllumazine synthase [Pelagibacteraceae bacterium TMED136]|tara:strand:- start:88 stop:498 length:411 start_codon:yes stop_codon:yes gene_type:complete